jgi:hypothetical protein
MLGNQMLPVVHMFRPNNDAILQDDISPMHTARIVQSWFEEHEDALQHLLWPAQSSYLNIIEPQLSIVESRVRSRIPPPTTLKQSEYVLLEEWYSIPLQTIQSLFQEGYKLYYRQMVVKLRINGEICIFHNFFSYFVHSLYVCTYVCLYLRMYFLFLTQAALRLCEPMAVL